MYFIKYSKMKMSRMVAILMFLGISCVSSEIIKRAAILSTSSSLDTEHENNLDSIFVTKRMKFPGGSRTSRNLFNETKVNVSSGTISASTSTDSESARKASPDVQDIIDGIVKLLGGKVHPGTPPQQQQTLQQQQQQQLLLQQQQQQLLLSQQQQQQQQQMSQHQLLPQQQQIPASYNLFNPPQSVAKPSRINNRGPPLTENRPIPLPPPVDISLSRPENHGNGQQQHPQQQQQQQQYLDHRDRPVPQQDNRVQHIPFPQQQPQPQQPHQQYPSSGENRPPVGDRGQGNHFRDRDRPSMVVFQDNYNNRPNSQSPPGEMLMGRPNPTGPGSTFEAIPIEAMNGFRENNNTSMKTRLGPPYPLPSQASYNPLMTSTKHKPIPEAPYRKGIPLPEQLVPPKFGTPQSTNQWPKVPSPPPIPPLHTDQSKIIGIGSNLESNKNKDYEEYEKENENENENNRDEEEIEDYERVKSSAAPNPTTSAVGTTTSPGTKKPTSLLVPLPITTSPPPAEIQMEDDEAEDEGPITHNLDSTIKDNVGIDIDPSSASSLQPSQDHNQNQDLSQFIVPESVSSSHGVADSSSSSHSISGLHLHGSMNVLQVRPTNVQEEPAVQLQVTPTIGFTTSTTTTSASTPSTTFHEISSSSLSTTPTPPLRPGLVINDGPPRSVVQKMPGGIAGGYGSVEVVTAEGLGGHGGQVGDIFDVTVTAKQHYGGQATGQPFVIPVDLKDELITQPNGDQQFVSIDGKRQYFNLHGPNSGGAGGVVGMGSVTQTASGPLAHAPSTSNSHSNTKSASQSQLNIPIRPISTTLTINPGPNSNVNANSPLVSINSNANPSSSNNNMTPSKTPPNIIRRPISRPSVPPVRIDTCIVGDDSTCNSEQFEICRTESGVSSCLCRSGYARRRHREPCKAIVSMILSMKLDKLGDKKLNKYNPDYFNPNSEIYQSLEWETLHALDSALTDTPLQSSFVGAKLDAIGFDGRHAVVNTTVLIQENPKMTSNQVKRELQRQLIQSLTKSRNNFGKSQLWVEGPISAVAAIGDVNECENPDLNDCDGKAKCVNTFGSFECKCEAGYGDPHEKDKRLSGRKCESCNGKTYCNGRGECLIDKGQRICKCTGNYYGSQCDIDGEVLAVAIGASVSAVVIIGLTLACLCMWSRRWKREEQKAALMSRTLFGGMASQALSYLSKNTMNSSNNPYQQHVTMDDRLRWAQVADTNLNGNIYVQNEPMSMCPPSMSMMDTRRSAETLDTTVDDIFDDRHPTKRPRSRSSQMQNGGIYYDLEPQSEMYASSPMVPFPAQFCVPSMNPYVRSGYYN